MKPGQAKDCDPKEDPDEKRCAGKVEGNQRDQRYWNEEDDRKGSALLNPEGKDRSHCEGDELPPPCCLQRHLVDHNVTRILPFNVEFDQR